MLRTPFPPRGRPPRKNRSAKEYFIKAQLLPVLRCSAPFLRLRARGSENTPRIRIAYFSLSGNTRLIARDIQSMIGGDLFEIRAVREYGPDFDSAVEQAREELHTQVRPSFPPAPLRLHLFHPRLFACTFSTRASLCPRGAPEQRRPRRSLLTVLS